MAVGCTPAKNTDDRSPRGSRICRALTARQHHALLFTLALSCAPEPQSPTAEAGAATNQAATVGQTITTSLTAPACITLGVQAEGGNSTQRCPGISGYQLLVLDSDSRTSVTLLDPQKRQWPLSYERIISPHFTSLGPVAVWRVVERDADGDLIALIVKVDANEDPESERITSYWAVARVAPSGSCVTDRVKAGTDESARLEAAVLMIKDRPCLSSR